MRKAILAALVAAAAAVMPAGGAGAQTFPERGKTITLIVPYAPGGGVDFVARATASALERELSTPVQVVNRPGAGAQVALTGLVRSRPDGYTLAMVVMPTVLTHYLDPSRNAIYTRTSFEPIARLYSVSYAVAVPASSPYRDFRSFIAAARANPERIKIADAGLRTAPHVMLSQLEQAAGVRFASVHFTGGAPAMAALLGGHVDGMSGGGSDFVPQLASGQIRVLAVTTDGEDPLLPGVPSMRSMGVDVLFSTATGIAGPAGIPPATVRVLEAALTRIAATDAWKQALLGHGITPTFLGAAGYGEFWARYDETVGPVIRAMIAR